MFILYLCIIFFICNLTSNGGILSVDITLNNEACQPSRLIVLAEQELQMSIVHLTREICNAQCADKNNHSNIFASSFKQQDKGIIMTIKNVSSDMGRKWKCYFGLNGDPYQTNCVLDVNYRNRNEAALLVNNISDTRETDLLSEYDAVGHYYFGLGEKIHVACGSQAPNKYLNCHIVLKYAYSNGDHIQSSARYSIKPNECKTVTILRTLESYSHKSYFTCNANGYITMVILNLRSPMYDYSPKQDTYGGFDGSITTNTVQPVTVMVTPPSTVNPGTGYANTTTQHSTPANTDDLDTIPWSLLVVGCGVGVIAVFACLIFIRFSKHIKDRKRQHTEGNYENLSNNSLLPHPNQWEEPIYAEANTTQPAAGCGAQYQNNLDALYARPIPKIDRPKHIKNASNGEYAEVVGGGNEVIDNNEKLNYAQVQFDKDASADRLVTRREDEPQYSEVVQPSVEYGNVFADGRYVNAHTTSEYAEPAYCGIHFHKP